MATTHNHLSVIARDNFRLRHIVVEVGVVGLVAGGVHTISDVDRVILHLLHIVTDKPTITLLCGDTLNLGALALDVVGDGIHIQRGAALREEGACYGGHAVNGVDLAVGVDILAVEVDVHKISLQIHIVVCYIALLVDIDHLLAHIVVERVCRTALNDAVEARARLAAIDDGVAKCCQ